MPRRGYPSSNGENIVCPCFRRTADREIWCESHVQECGITVLRYRDLKAYEKQKRIYCQENYERCEHYLAVKHLK